MAKDYQKVPTSLEDDGASDECIEVLQSRGTRLRRWMEVCWVALAGLAGFLVGASIVGAFASLKRSALCLGFTSRPSPITGDIQIHYSAVNFNGSLMKENIYRQDASPQVDAAWSALGVDYRAVAVPESLAEELGISRDQVKIREEYGGGYPANVEGLHQLHCLNLLRQALYYNYDYYRVQGLGAFKNDDNIVRVHVSHCLDILRQQLMCTVDIGVFGQVWVQTDPKEAPFAYVDFNTKHVCRNFEDVRKWAEERQLPPPDDVPDDYLDPPKAGHRVYTEIP